MRIPTGPKSGNSGYYGGVGSKAAPKTWTPGAKAKPLAPGKRRRLPRLQLKRRRRPRMEGDEPTINLALFLVGGIFCAGIVYILGGLVLELFRA